METNKVREYLEGVTKLSTYLASTSPTALSALKKGDYNLVRERCLGGIAIAAKIVDYLDKTETLLPKDNSVDTTVAQMCEGGKE